MARLKTVIKKYLRTLVQIAFAAISNGYAAGFAKGTIYRGSGKAICLPGLNCYSCPGSLGSCPIGALQAVIGSHKYKFSFYVIGFLIFVGALFGRLVCGWMCPFGLIQDLLNKIPFPKKLRKLPGDRILKYIKYVILVGFVVILPLTVLDIVGQGQPWFCKYICPSGTLFGGIPLIASNPLLRDTLGWLFKWKLVLLILILLLSVIVYRPFCRYLCPLGAIYGFFNPIALYRYKIIEENCIKCGACQAKCNLDIPIYKLPNSMECIRCGECMKVCKTNAITTCTGKK